MKRAIYILSVVCGGLLATSCSGDYLNTVPENAVDSPDVFATTEIAAMAVNGVAEIMNMPFYYPSYEAPATSDFGGEGSIKMLYGNNMGNHFVCSDKDAFGVLFKGTNYMSQTGSVYCFYPWWYYYMLIGNANSIIVNIDGAEGPESERQRILAQGLTFRAYAYTMLAQLYCKRWIESDGGATEGVVLRVDASSGGQKLCTLKELYKQIYDDLDKAIELFETSEYKRKQGQNQLPDAQVAHAVYARAALNRTDYVTAATQARAAREGYPLMKAEDYMTGFNTRNSEWIWSSSNTELGGIGQFSFFARLAYNSRISEASKTKCISRELYNRIPQTDIRRNLFLNPDGLAYSNTTGLADSDLKAKARKLFPDIYASLPIYAYMQFKFKAADNTGAGDVNHFRSSEMYLIEAEAEFFQDNETKAQEALIALVKTTERDKSYECNKTGQALLDEIKLYRAIELWGEGFDWFDMKRWGDTIDRKTFSKGGNFTVKTGFTTAPDENNAWCWLIPAFETDFNPGI